MLSCRVSVGPIATDKEYQTGDTVCLDKKDADTLAGFGLVEIIGDVETKFVAQVVPTTGATEATKTIEMFPVAEVAPVIETPVPVTVPIPVETPAPVVTEPVVVVPVIETPVPPQDPELDILATEETLGLEKTETQTQETTTDRKRK